MHVHKNETINRTLVIPTRLAAGTTVVEFSTVGAIMSVPCAIEGPNTDAASQANIHVG